MESSSPTLVPPRIWGDICPAAKSLLAGLVVLGCMHRGLAQAPSDSPQSTACLIVNVIDSHGIPIRDLTRENFALFLNGRPAVVTNARYSLAPHRVIVLLDVSGSMAGETSSNKWRIAEEAVRDLLAQTAPAVPVAMITFASEVQTRFDFREDRTATLSWLLQNIDRPPKLKKKKTAVFDAIESALELLGNAQRGDAIYAITDGGDNASGLSAHKVKEDLLRSGVRLFSLLFVGPVPPQEAEGEDAFAGMIQDSGGQAFVVPGTRIPGVPWDAQYTYDSAKRENIKAYTTALNIQINGFWALDLEPMSLGPGKVKLTVTDDRRKELKNVVVTYPRRLLSANESLQKRNR